MDVPLDPAAAPDPLLATVREQIAFLLSEPLNFRATDTASVLRQVRLLTAAATYFNIVTVAEFGGRGGAARAPGLVEQVVASAFQSFGGVEPHAAPFARAAALLRGITQGHPFNDGNKRTGFLLAAYYLELVGHPTPDMLPEDAVVAFCLVVSAGELRDLAAIADALRAFWQADLGPATRELDV